MKTLLLMLFAVMATAKIQMTTFFPKALDYLGQAIELGSFVVWYYGAPVVNYVLELWPW